MWSAVLTNDDIALFGVSWLCVCTRLHDFVDELCFELWNCPVCSLVLLLSGIAIITIVGGLVSVIVVDAATTVTATTATIVGLDYIAITTVGLIDTVYKIGLTERIGVGYRGVGFWSTGCYEFAYLSP